LAGKPTCRDLEFRIGELEKEIEARRIETESLKIIKERYDALFNQSIDCVFVLDLEGKFIDGNPMAMGLLGFSPEEGLSLNIMDLIPKEQIPQYLSHIKEILESGTQKYMGEFSLKHRDGSVIHLETNASAIYSDGKINSIQGVARNISQRKQMEEDLKNKWEALKNAPIGVYIVQDKKFVWTNQRFSHEVGYSEQELIGMKAMDLVVPEDRAVLRENMILMLKGRSEHPFEYRTISPKHKKERWVRGEVVSTTFKGNRAVLGYYSDIDKLMIQNITDSLTGLFNRRYIFQLAEQMVDTANRYEHPLSFAIFDVDHFKNYNDRFGHTEGDRALARVGQITRNATRRVDICGRYGGEEFCVILPNTAIDSGVRVAKRLKSAMEKETRETDLISGLTISVGVAQLKPRWTFLDLLNEADARLYDAKITGRNRVVF
jgi:diguanylate cyclase (GGDEF)-like protein/PAS domain S-box-containing protein